MTSPVVIGAVTNRPQQISSYTLPAKAVQTTSPTVTEAVTPPSPAPTPPVYVTVGNVTSVPDNPGMISYPVKEFFLQVQNDTIRSAAQNTAAAFGLNIVISGDQAVLKNNTYLLQRVNAIPIPTIETDQTLIPA
jgi:hypothetical protein